MNGRNTDWTPSCARCSRILRARTNSPTMYVFLIEEHLVNNILNQCNIGAMYTALYNLLDFTAGTVPVTHVTVEDEKECAAVYPAHVDMWAKAIRTQFSKDTV